MTKRKKNRIKLPKHIFGIKVPKDMRKSANRLLKGEPEIQSKQLVTAAMAALGAALAERLEEPLTALLQKYADGKGGQWKKPEPEPTAVH